MTGTSNRWATAESGLGQTMAEFMVETRGPGFTDITSRLARWLSELGADDGLLTVFIRHTSASLTIQENADPDVQADLMDALSTLAPAEAPYRHHVEGPDDMPAHIKAVLTSTCLTIPVMGGRMTLGTWQAAYVIEHRARAHQRTLTVHFTGTRRS
jgi:secondary thiamine-phosphate synthase enzyme